MMKNKNYLYNISIALIGVIVILLIYIGSTVGNKVRVDVTDEGLYSLSDGTKKILKKLSTPIHLKLYYSKTAANKGTEGIRAFNTYFVYVRDLLNEFVSHSDNNLTLEVIDPRPDTEDEEDATYYGLKKFNLTQTESYFFGLVAKTETGSEKIIEFFDPNKQETVEYDVAKIIYSVTHPNKKKIGLLTSLDLLADEMSPYMIQMMAMQGKKAPQGWMSIMAMKELYEIKKISTDVDKIDGIDALMVIHPKDLSEKTQFAIDQYVLNGGNVLLLVDPHLIAEANNMANPMMMGGMQPKTNSNLPRLMKAWGVEMEEGQFAGDKSLAGLARINPYGPPKKMIPLMNCDERCTQKYKDSTSAGLNNLVFLFPGALKKVDEEGKTITPIISTTTKGNTYTAGPYELQSPSAINKKFVEGDKEVVLAYKITGKFKSAFPNGVTYEVKSKDDKKKDKNDRSEKKVLTGIKESTKESAIIVVANVDFMADEVAFRSTLFGPSVVNDNLSFLMNSVENLIGSTELVSIRSKGQFTRTFDVIEKIEEQAEKATEGKVSQINSSIQGFQKELNEFGRKANKENIFLLQNEGIKRKKELEKKIAILKKELRDVKRQGREKIEALGASLQYMNTLSIPLVLLIFGLYRGTRRGKVQRHLHQ